jgi:hypothetical protein
MLVVFEFVIKIVFLNKYPFYFSAPALYRVSQGRRGKPFLGSGYY